MSDVFQIVRAGTIFVGRRCRGCGRHAVSATKARKEYTQQVRCDNVLMVHFSSTDSETSQFSCANARMIKYESDKLSDIIFRRLFCRCTYWAHLHPWWTGIRG